MARNIYLVLMILLLFLSGCQYSEINKSNTNLNKQVDKQEVVSELKSPNDMYTAYIRGEGRLLYIGNGYDEDKAAKVRSGLEEYQHLSWSPDSSYLFAGSTKSGKGVIIDPERLISVGELNDYLSGPFWSTDGDKACFTVRRNIWMGNDVNEETTTDLVVIKINDRLNVESRLARGNLKYYFEVEGWGDDGIIKYAKYSRQDNRLLEKLTAEFLHHIWEVDIGTGERKEIAANQEIQYSYFNLSPNREWLSMIKITSSSGEGQEGIPYLYHLTDEKLMSMEEDVKGWSYDTKWFGDSSRIMLDWKSVYDLNAREATACQIPNNMIPLSVEPSPDGSKIAVFAYQLEKETGIQQEPIILYLLDSLNMKVIKTIETSLRAKEGNWGNPESLRFSWTKDNQGLIVESWVAEEYWKSSLWKINLTDDSIAEFSKSGQYPLVSPDGQKVVYLTQEYTNDEHNLNPNTILKVVSTDNDGLITFDMAHYGVYAFAGQMLWDSSSDSIVTTAYFYEDGIDNKYLLGWDTSGKSMKKILVDYSATLLCSENGKVVCIDGSIY